MKAIAKVFVVASLAAPVTGFLAHFLGIVLLYGVASLIPPNAPFTYTNYILTVLVSLINILIVGVVFRFLKISHYPSTILLATITLLPLPGLYASSALLLYNPHNPLLSLMLIFVGVVYSGYYALLNLNKGEFKTRILIGLAIALVIVGLISLTLLKLPIILSDLTYPLFFSY